MGSPSNADRLCSDFAGQLESLGLWHWAVFVLLHIKVFGIIFMHEATSSVKFVGPSVITVSSLGAFSSS